MWFVRLSSARLRRAAVSTAGALVISAFLASEAESARAPAPAFTPNDLFVGGQDAATGQAAVFEFEPSGKFVRKIPVATGRAGDRIWGVAFGPDGALYCAAHEAGKIVRVDPSLAVTDRSIGYALDHPAGIVFGPDGRLIVASRVPGGPVLLEGGREYRVGPDLSPTWLTYRWDGRIFLTLHSDTAAAEVHALEHGYGGLVLLSSSSPVADSADGPAAFIFSPTGLGGGNDALSGGAAVGPDGYIWRVNAGGDGVEAPNPDAPAGPPLRTTDANVGLSKAQGVAFAPFRFRAKMSATISSLRKESTSDNVVSLWPGPGTVMFGLPYPDGGVSSDPFLRPSVFVFRGVQAGALFAGDDGTLIAQGQSSMWGGRYASIGLVAKGSRDANGFFVPKSISGSLAVQHAEAPTRATAAFATFSATKRVP